MTATTITTIPLEIIIDNILPLLSLNDIKNLSNTSKFFKLLLNLQLIWKRKLFKDFNEFITLRYFLNYSNKLNFKLIYNRLLYPQIYVWGSANNGRLGLNINDNRIKRGNCVPSPLKLNLKAKSIVKLVCGGYSFHALDSNGKLYVWGTYDGRLPSFGTTDYRKQSTRIQKPKLIGLPFKVKDVTSGRCHILLLSEDNQLYESLSAALPHKIVHPMLDDGILSISSGWSHSTVLLKSDIICVFWGSDQVTENEDYAHNFNIGPKQHIYDYDNDNIDDAIQTHLFNLSIPMLILPRIVNEKVYKITNVDEAVIVLTESRKLFRADISSRNFNGNSKIDHLSNLFQTNQRQWIELNNFSKDALKHNLSGNLPMPDISHISSSYRNFNIYSQSTDNSIVFSGNATTNSPEAYLLNGLKNKGVVDIAQGDHHSIALTQSGEIFSWGSQRGGALGIPTINYARDGMIGEPLKVEFEEENEEGQIRKKFAFSIAAGGWHSAALVIDLDERPLKEEKVNESNSNENINDNNEINDKQLNNKFMNNMRIGMIRRP